MLNSPGKHNPLPLYQQLKAVIEDRIDAGEWLPGTQVPSERELCLQFKISRITVRQAIADLVNEGRLTRTQGRGTFVAYPRIEQRLSRLTGFTQDMHARGQRPGAQVLQLESVPALPSIARALQLKVGDPVILLKRLRLADGEPLAVETAHLPDRVCHGLLKEKLEGKSLYDFLRKNYNIHPARAEQQLEAVACPPVEANLLGVRKGSPVLHIHRTTYGHDGRPFEIVESFYRGDKYVFHAELNGE